MVYLESPNFSALHRQEKNHFMAIFNGANPSLEQFVTNLATILVTLQFGDI